MNIRYIYIKYAVETSTLVIGGRIGGTSDCLFAFVHPTHRHQLQWLSVRRRTVLGKEPVAVGGLRHVDLANDGVLRTGAEEISAISGMPSYAAPMLEE